MARQIAYDPEKLRRDVMTLFWTKGYSDTSLVDLEAATGLNRRQLYNGIGDKRDMFVAAMDDFITMSGQSLLAPLEAKDAGIRDIADLFAKFIAASDLTSGPKGCLVCSTSQDDIAADPGIAKRINGFLDRVRDAHLNALSQAKRRGEISLNMSEQARRADVLLGVHVALCIMSRANRPKNQLTEIARHAIADLT